MTFKNPSRNILGRLPAAFFALVVVLMLTASGLGTGRVLLAAFAFAALVGSAASHQLQEQAQPLTSLISRFVLPAAAR